MVFDYLSLALQKIWTPIKSFIFFVTNFNDANFDSQTLEGGEIILTHGCKHLIEKDVWKYRRETCSLH